MSSRLRPQLGYLIDETVDTALEVLHQLVILLLVATAGFDNHGFVLCFVYKKKSCFEILFQKRSADVKGDSIRKRGA